MRVTTAQLSTTLAREMNAASRRHIDDWNRVASGERISQPSDDPLGSVGQNAILREIDRIEGYQNNTSMLHIQLQHEDVLLQSYGTVLDQVRQLVLQANSGVVSVEEMQVLSLTVDAWIETLVNLLNTRSSEEGVYLFAGTQSDRAPVERQDDGSFLCNHNDTVREVSVAEGIRIAGWDTAETLSFNLPVSSESNLSFNILDQLQTLRCVLSSSPLSQALFCETIAQTLERLDVALERLRGMHARLGMRMRMLETFASNHRRILLEYRKNLSHIIDLDYPKTLSRINSQELALDAARQGISRISSLSLFNYL